MRIVSGIQPTGEIHLGNYFGALANWVNIQNEGHECFIFIVNQHAITLPQDGQALKEYTLKLAAMLLAVGLNPEKTTIFVQSDVPAHAQFTWILNCLAPIGIMEGMIQYKEKSEQNPKAVNIGLLTYPILQTADILLYKPDAVPVGVDQSQHLELTRKLVRKFNNTYKPIFKEPKTMLTPTPKIMGLDGSAKMSKSKNNYIALSESEKEIWEKLAPAKTDPARIKKTDPGDPDKCNIYSLHKLFSQREDLDWVNYGCRNATIGCIECKKRLHKNMVEKLKPIRDKYLEWMSKPEELKDILRRGAEKANKIAQQTLEEVYDLVGFKY